jgi:hypothetical protein
VVIDTGTVCQTVLLRNGSQTPPRDEIGFDLSCWSALPSKFVLKGEFQRANITRTKLLRTFRGSLVLIASVVTVVSIVFAAMRISGVRWFVRRPKYVPKNKQFQLWFWLEDVEKSMVGHGRLHRSQR